MQKPAVAGRGVMPETTIYAIALKPLIAVVLLPIFIYFKITLKRIVWFLYRFIPEGKLRDILYHETLI